MLKNSSNNISMAHYETCTASRFFHQFANFFIFKTFNPKNSICPIFGLADPFSVLLLRILHLFISLDTLKEKATRQQKHAALEDYQTTWEIRGKLKQNKTAKISE